MRKVSQETSLCNPRVGPKAHRVCMSQDSAEKHQQQGGWVDGWMDRTCQNYDAKFESQNLARMEEILILIIQ